MSEVGRKVADHSTGLRIGSKLAREGDNIYWKPETIRILRLSVKRFVSKVPEVTFLQPKLLLARSVEIES